MADRGKKMLLILVIIIYLLKNSYNNLFSIILLVIHVLGSSAGPSPVVAEKKREAGLLGPGGRGSPCL